MSLIQRALIFGTAAVVVLVALAVAGWWFFAREDAELATDPPDIPAELVATEQPAANGDGEVITYRIIPEESEAAYFVGEELASLPLPSTAKGVTNAIQGEFHLSADGSELAPGRESQFTVDLTTLASDEDRRDNRVQDALQTSLYPFATFTISSATGYNAAIPDGEEQALQLAGILDLHGVQREVVWEVEARRQGNVVAALATVTFDFADFEITPPNIAGFVSVGDEATLQVQVIARAA